MKASVVAHKDLATAYYISDRLIMMQCGRMVEMSDARTVLDNPEHAYSRLLKASVLSSEDAGAGKLVERLDGRAVRVYEAA